MNIKTEINNIFTKEGEVYFTAKIDSENFKILAYLKVDETCVAAEVQHKTDKSMSYAINGHQNDNLLDFLDLHQIQPIKIIIDNDEDLNLDTCNPQ